MYMNVQIYSDLHLENHKKYYPLIKPETEILILF